MIQAYQQTMMRTELERLRDENAEQRRLLEKARDALNTSMTPPDTTQYRRECFVHDAITQHLKGKA